MTAEYSITKDGNWITGDMTTGRYGWTKNREFRYTFEDIKQVESIIAQFPGAELYIE